LIILCISSINLVKKLLKNLYWNLNKFL
jgi:hypothetical protein